MDTKVTKLPEGWIVQTSKSLPNRVYYFNKRTNKASWEVPVDDTEDAGTSNASTKGKKRKGSAYEHLSGQRPITPELDISQKPKPVERRVLIAKRSVVQDVQKDGSAQNAEGPKSKDTPQMQLLREKILQRQAKGNAPRRSKPTVLLDPRKNRRDSQKEPEKGPMEAAPSPSDPVQTETLTPQMKVLLEKVKSRQSKASNSKNGEKKVVKEETKVPTLRRPRKKSLASIDLKTNDKTTLPRRSSRSIATISTNGKSCSSIDENTTTIRPTVLIRGEIEKKMREESSPKTEETSIRRQTIDTISPIKATRSMRLGRSAIRKKNLAEERLLNLQKSFTEDQSEVDGPSLKPAKPPECRKILRLDDSLTFQQESSSPPSIYKNAEFRAKFLRERMHNKTSYDRRTAMSRKEDSNCNIEEPPMKIPAPDDFYEEMEWEPIEDEKIMLEIQAVRSHIVALGDSVENQEIPEMSLDLTDGRSEEQKKHLLYIVVDTNVFLSNINAVEEARDAIFKTYGRPLIVIPWTVIRELDFIKDDKSMSRPEGLRAKARHAVRFLHQHFSARHPRVLGQTPFDVSTNRQRFELECPDDEILQTCLQIRISNNCVVLLSYDKNLCNKAMIHDVLTLGRNDPLEKVDYIHASDARNESFLSLHLRGEEENPDIVPIYVKELRKAEEIFGEMKEVLTSFLTVIVAKEMQNLYHENWEKFTIIRPPWSVFAVLKCAIKHWIAAVSDSFSRKAEPILRDLLEAMNNVPDSGRKLNDVSHILEMTNNLLQCVVVEKHPSVVERSARVIAELRIKTAEAVRQLNQEKINDTYGQKNDTREEEARAELVFQQFDEVYAFARDMCGLSSDAIGMSCSFPYKRLNPEPSIDDIKDMQPDVAANVNRLMQVLSTALEEINGLHVDHRAVVALYHALANFMPEQKGYVRQDFSPYDVYCCLKRKEKLLRLGVGQLQELSGQFCRMASFRCT